MTACASMRPGVCRVRVVVPRQYPVVRVHIPVGPKIIRVQASDVTKAALTARDVARASADMAERDRARAEAAAEGSRADRVAADALATIAQTAASLAQAAAAQAEAAIGDRPNTISRVLGEGQATIALGGHRVLRFDGVGLAYASADDVLQFGSAIGVSLHAAEAGAAIAYVTHGLMDEPSWAWAPNAPVYLGASGLLTQVEPSRFRFWQQIGRALGPTRLLVSIATPVLIA